MCEHPVSRSFPVDGVERSINLRRNSSCVNGRTSNDTGCTTADAFIGDGEMRFHGAPFPSLPARQTRQRSKQEVLQSMSLTTGSGQQARVSRHQHRTSSFLLCETGVLTATCRTKLHHGVLAVQHATRDDACCEQVRVGNPVPRSETLRRQRQDGCTHLPASRLHSHAARAWAGIPFRAEEDEEEEKKVALAPDVVRRWHPQKNSHWRGTWSIRAEADHTSSMRQVR